MKEIFTTSRVKEYLKFVTKVSYHEPPIPLPTNTNNLHLSSVNKVRSLITQHPNLSIRLALNPMIALTLPTLLILRLERKVSH